MQLMECIGWKCSLNSYGMINVYVFGTLYFIKHSLHITQHTKQPCSSLSLVLTYLVEELCLEGVCKVRGVAKSESKLHTCTEKFSLGTLDG